MKPRILIIYYSQTGQLRHILDCVTAELTSRADLTFYEIQPITPFPFPWTALQFFDAMPETVVHRPSAIMPMPDDIKNGQYDLVILGYQPWFLNPSQPITAFLQSEDAKVLSGKPVVTIVGCRNMWLYAQEKTKQYIIKNEGRLVGNIVLNDTNPNLISLLTIIRWAFKGQKKASGVLPDAGVQELDILNSRKYGLPILYHLKDDNLIDLQRAFLALGAVELKPGLVVLEQKGIKNFRFWAKFIREKGGPGDPARAERVLLFKNLLLVGIFVLSPISTVAALIRQAANMNKLMRDVAYFRQTEFEEGVI